MKLLVFVSCVVAAAHCQLLLYQAPLLPHNYLAAAPPLLPPLLSHFRAQDELGQFAFATAGDNQGRVESKALDGAVRGAYSYVDPAGKLVRVQYVADDGGFRVVGANNLPEAPVAGPEPVQDTPEVVAARAQFQKQFDEAARSAEQAPDAAPAASRRRRQALLLPAAAKTTVKVAKYEPVDAAVPASTRKVELKEEEKEVAVPLPLAYAVHLQAVPPATRKELPLTYTVLPAGRLLVF